MSRNQDLEDPTMLFAPGSNVGHMDVYRVRDQRTGDVIYRPYTEITLSPAAVAGRGFNLLTPKQFAINTWPNHRDAILQVVPTAKDVGGVSREWIAFVAEDTRRAAQFADQWQISAFPADVVQNPLAQPAHGAASVWWNPVNLALFLTDFQGNLKSCTLRTAASILMQQGGFDWITSGSALALTLSHFGGGWSPLDVPENVYGKLPQLHRFHAFNYAIEANGNVEFESGITWAKGGPLPTRYGGGDMPIGELAQEKLMGNEDLYFFTPSDLALPLQLSLEFNSYLTLSGQFGPVTLTQAYYDVANPPVWPWTDQELHDVLMQLGAWYQKILARQQTQRAPIAAARRQPLYLEVAQLSGFNPPDPIVSVIEAMLGQADPYNYLKSLTNWQKGDIYAQRLHDFYAFYRTAFPTWNPLPDSPFKQFREPFMVAHGIDCSDLP